MVLWAMHPWERGVRLAHHVLHQHHPAAIVVEVTCTRSAVELLSAFRVTAVGRTLQRYGVLEEAGWESAPRGVGVLPWWSKKQASEREREKKNREENYAPSV